MSFYINFVFHLHKTSYADVETLITTKRYFGMILKTKNNWNKYNDQQYKYNNLSV